MTTFDVTDVPIDGPLFPPSTLGHALERLGVPYEACGSNLPLCQVPDGTDWSPVPHHGFAAAVHHAFAAHHPLVLSPDDVWLCIAQGFAMHVDVNAKALRDRFVVHEGQATIEVRRDDFVKGSPDNDWPACLSQLSDGIAQYLGKKRDLVVADFSTTGPIEKAASEIVLMSAMRHYFQYQVMTLCGIPRVTLLGTIDDWRSIRRRVEALSELDLGWWTTPLLPVVDQLVASAAGQPDKGFWGSFYKWKSESGGPCVTGWINVLFPYLQPLGERRKTAAPVRNAFLANWAESFGKSHGGGPGPQQFPAGVSKAPFVWKYFGETFPMALFGGFMGVSQDPSTRALRPVMGWAVADDAPSRSDEAR